MPDQAGATIRVLIVDDSAIFRRALAAQLGRYDDIQVVGSAVDPYDAREKIAALRPDVLTLDIQMPRMDGLTFLQALMTHHPLPVVVVSSIAPPDSEVGLRALELGAVEVVAKPGSTFSTPHDPHLLARAIRTAAVARLSLFVSPALAIRPATPREPAGALTPLAGPAAWEPTWRVIVIGASTGGTVAIETVLASLPAHAPPVVVVQHMPAGFTAAFAQRLDSICAVRVHEAQQGEEPVAGEALIAPGGRHLLLRQHGHGFVVQLKDGPAVYHQRPSVDVLFQSVAACAGGHAIGVLLTGMGADGANGLLALRQRGAFTIAQDEQTSVVFGMPKEAIKLGAAEVVLPLHHIGPAIVEHMGQAHVTGASTPTSTRTPK